MMPPLNTLGRIATVSPAPQLEKLEERKRLELFVGREPEQAAFRCILAEDGPWVLYVWGPAGIGKTTLLMAFAAEAARCGRATVRLDARYLDLALPNVLAALEEAGLVALEEPALGAVLVVLLDSYEHLKPIEPLVLRELLRRVRGDVRLVVASRTPPSADWRTLSLWRSAVVPLPLRNLEPAAAASYLARRGMSSEAIKAVHKFSHGHPLALALAADAWQQAPDRPFAPERAPDIVTALYEYFVREVATLDRRAALEAIAVLHTTSEVMLAALLDGDAAAAFAWLRELSFVQVGPRGLLPHDLAREVILAELRWRNPARLAALALRVQRYCTERLRHVEGDEAVQLMDEFTFVMGHDPRLRFMVVPPDEGLTVDDLRPGDERVLEAATLRHEGPMSLRHLRHWLRHQPPAFKIVRAPDGTITGFAALLSLDQTTAAERSPDPLARSVWDYATALLGGPPRGRLYLGRFLLACETGQTHSPTMTIAILIGPRQFVLTRNVELAFLRLHSGRCWDPLAAVSGVRFIADLEHQEDGKMYEVTLLDLRSDSHVGWLAAMNERPTVGKWSAPTAPTAHDPEPMLAALSRDEFGKCVHDALRTLHVPALLAKNSLVHAQVVRCHAPPGATPAELVRVLQMMLRQEVAALPGGPQRGAAWSDVLDRAYVHPATKHSAAATDLGLKYITFRRRLKEAVEQLATVLWERELAAQTP